MKKIKTLVFSVAMALLMAACAKAAPIECQDYTTRDSLYTTCNSNGALYIDFATTTLVTSFNLIKDFDSATGTVGAATTTTETLAATSSAFMFSNECTGSLRIMLDSEATSAVGLYVGAYGTVSSTGIEITSISVYNPSATTTCSYSIIAGRKPE